MSDNCPIWNTRAACKSYESALGSTRHWISGFRVDSDRSASELGLLIEDH